MRGTFRRSSSPDTTPATRGAAAALVAALVAATALFASAAPASAVEPAGSDAGPVIVYRFWNRATGTHFYTASEAERLNVSATWPSILRFEGVAYTVETTGTAAATPLHRFYNLRTATHFYTADDAERATIIATWPGLYRYEGVAYGVSATGDGGGTPVWRFYNYRRGGVHFYTASTEERDRVIATLGGTYRFEGVAFFVSSAPLVPRIPVVCIDPGHQAHADLTLEPIGPGATEYKPKVAAGTCGVATGIPEYRFTLPVSFKIAERLEARGVRVVMTRTTNDVNIANSDRARMANDAGADLFVRIHADGSENQSVRGLTVLYPGGNAWVAPIEGPSWQASSIVRAAVIARTGAVDRGLSRRGDMAGFNYSVVPALIVECGFMTNPAEDRLLATDAYQNALADGIAEGVLTYLGR